MILTPGTVLRVENGFYTHDAEFTHDVGYVSSGGLVMILNLGEVGRGRLVMLSPGTAIAFLQSSWGSSGWCMEAVLANACHPVVRRGIL